MHDLGALRDIRSSELETMLAWRNSDRVRLMSFNRHVISLEEHLAWWKRANQRADQRFFMYEHTGAPSGIVSFIDINPVDQHASWSIYSGPAALPGAGKRMAVLALDHAFNDLALHRVSAQVLDINQKSLTFHIGVGFQLEGTQREQHRLDHRHIDVHQLGILAHEWQLHRPRIIDKLHTKKSA
jgi:UDP-4-amino-4,6-dideoxy-N-acetyl-beta-L-altrosamine N-acetyltransferase